MKLTEERLLSRIEELARQAGEAIMQVYNAGDFDVTFKKDDISSPLTKADTEANEIITTGLKTLDPEIPILSEESAAAPYDERKSWKRFWLVDPLDGTKEFINKRDQFTVNIALIEYRKPVMGVVYAPALSTLYFGGHNVGGAFKISQGVYEKISVSNYQENTLKVVASLSHQSQELKDFIDSIGPAECVSMGSSLKLCLVAEGAAHLYPRLGPTMEWDTAAAHAIVNCAGGTVTDLEGAPLSYNKENLLNPFFMVTGSPAFPWQDHIKGNA